ncbi:MAG: class I SAM-dependent methyltransferase [Planctomycetota bacterium]|nr:MAG: class I SAM-dependent methyltransferase [Planctomycetota bacterium]
MSDDFARDDDDNRAFYDQRAPVAVHGYQAADWGSQASQERRFEVLAAGGALGAGSVLDVGCGSGDLLHWLRARDWRGAYTGIDISDAMLARARAAAPDARFERASVLELGAQPVERCDWVLASGIFARRVHAPEEFFERALVAMLRAARRGVALNCLSSVGRAAEPGEWRCDPRLALSIARHRAGDSGGRAVLRDDYHPGDFTLYVYRA